MPILAEKRTVQRREPGLLLGVGKASVVVEVVKRKEVEGVTILPGADEGEEKTSVEEALFDERELLDCVERDTLVRGVGRPAGCLECA